MSEILQLNNVYLQGIISMDTIFEDKIRFNIPEKDKNIEFKKLYKTQIKLQMKKQKICHLTPD